ncbi:shikimate dehydrogenase, partial [candidate division FCPU426 bacterium]|nr:shikimate dehydrogenase [candidate division FCPU426 bacterium]
MRKQQIAVTGSTRIAGVVGWPIAHTLSPAMQNAAFRHHGLDVVYLPFGVPPEGLRIFMSAMKQIRPVGLNVTIPYKEKIMPYLDACAPSAREIGAVNTVVFQNGKTTGHNTDGYGFLRSIQSVVRPQGKTAVVLGGGGAGRAVAVTLALARIRQVIVVEVDARRLASLIGHIRRLGYSGAEGVKPNSALLHKR